MRRALGVLLKHRAELDHQPVACLSAAAQDVGHPEVEHRPLRDAVTQELEHRLDAAGLQPPVLGHVALAERGLTAAPSRRPACSTPSSAYGTPSGHTRP